MAVINANNTYPVRIPEGINFSQANSSQEKRLREIEELYKNGGDWVSAADTLGTTGNFVATPNESGAPTGAYRSISGASNGSMLWGMGGQMATGGVSEGTQVVSALDNSRWVVGANGELNPYVAAIEAADAGGKSGAVGNAGNAGAAPSASYSASGSSSYSRTSTPVETNPYTAAISAFDYGPAPEWGGSDYQARRDAAMQRAEDMKFSYDPNTDPSWLAYQKQYRREGDRATANALGQAAAMTGGMPSSYAVTAASQAGDYYASQLSDKLPQLYQDAYNRYLQEYQRQLGIADAYAGYDQTEYNRYLTRLGQYNTDRNFAYGAYRDQIGDQRYADETAYNRSRDALSDERYQTEWEAKQAQQALENARYDTEYGDKRHDAAVDEALAIAKYLGYVPEQYAELLGVPAGTQYYTLANSGSSSGGRSSGGSSSGASTLAKKFASMGSAQILAYIKKNFGEGVLADSDWALLTEAGIDPDWLRRNGFRTEAQQAIMNAESTGASYAIPSAYAALLDEIKANEGAGSTGGTDSGFIHNDATHTSMSYGFRRVWPTLRNDFDAGMSERELLQKIMRYRDNGTLTDDDVNVIIDQLGLERKTGGAGR